MFFTRWITRRVTISPEFLGRNLADVAKTQLMREVEGTAVDTGGFIITVTDWDPAPLANGLVDHLTGAVYYKMRFQAMMFRPFKNEVLDATVKSVSEVGVGVGVVVWWGAMGTTRAAAPRCAYSLLSSPLLPSSRWDFSLTRAPCPFLSPTT